ncbi:MAG: type II toxin-antitoxin system MqsR family toxin [Deltaproteobacteria bacterium]|nr:type II toxin-antitoxin system MqsR family toxin [Deltaproteobacteria bacterium]
MEKRKPHHNLKVFQEAFSRPSALAVTKTAFQNALALGFTRAGIVEVIQSMKRPHFYKSMTALADHKCWQDVYHVSWEEMILYVKYTDDVVTDFRLLSFKEK